MPLRCDTRFEKGGKKFGKRRDWTRGLHGLKTEARTRPVPEIVWPDPTRAAQLNLEPEPDPKSPPPPHNE